MSLRLIRNGSVVALRVRVWGEAWWVYACLGVGLRRIRPDGHVPWWWWLRAVVSASAWWKADAAGLDVWLLVFGVRLELKPARWDSGGGGNGERLAA